jgi:hypothetical protein
MMRRFLLVLLLSGLLPLSAHAEGCGILAGPQARFNSGPCYVNLRMAALCHPSGQVGPWYLYWPLDAHFQAPAMPQYPYWPVAMGLPGQGTNQAGKYPSGPNPFYGYPGQYDGQAPTNSYNPMMTPNPMPNMMQQPAPMQQPGPALGAPMSYGQPGPANFHAIQPASWYSPQGPSYWYGRGW